MIFALLIFIKIYFVFSQDFCGKVSINAGLIVNGIEARQGEFPFLVALYKLEDDEFFCAGNLITRRHVLSGKLEQRWLKHY